MLFLPPILSIDRVSVERLKEPDAEKLFKSQMWLVRQELIDG